MEEGSSSEGSNGGCNTSGAGYTGDEEYGEGWGGVKCYDDGCDSIMSELTDFSEDTTDKDTSYDEQTNLTNNSTNLTNNSTAWHSTTISQSTPTDMAFEIANLDTGSFMCQHYLQEPFELWSDAPGAEECTSRWLHRTMPCGVS